MADEQLRPKFVQIFMRETSESLARLEKKLDAIANQVAGGFTATQKQVDQLRENTVESFGLVCGVLQADSILLKDLDAQLTGIKVTVDDIDKTLNDPGESPPLPQPGPFGKLTQTSDRRDGMKRFLGYDVKLPAKQDGTVTQHLQVFTGDQLLSEGDLAADAVTASFEALGTIPGAAQSPPCTLKLTRTNDSGKPSDPAVQTFDVANTIPESAPGPMGEITQTTDRTVDDDAAPNAPV